MKKFSKFIVIYIFCILLLPISNFASSENQNFTLDSLDSNEFDIVDLINSVNESRELYFFENLLSFGIRFTGTSNCTQASDWIFSEFENMGLDVEFQDWKFEKFESRNVIATLPGVDPSSNAIYILCAHYDTIKISPGAADDGSGVVAVLCIAEILSRYSFNHTIKFIAFSGEEVGTYGSFSYAQDSYKNGDNIIAVLNLDIIGYAETTEGGRLLRFFHEEPSTWITEYAKTISEKYMNIIDMTVESLPNYPGADNQAFVDYGYDGVWIAQHDPNWAGHSENDTLEHINMTYQIKSTKLMLAILTELAMKPINIQVILKAPSEAKLYIGNHPIFNTPFAKYYFQRFRGITIAIGKPTAIAETICKVNVSYVIFVMDDMFMLWDDSPPYEWKIKGRFYPLIGRHTLKVFAYSETNEYDVDQMDIIFFTSSSLS